MTGLVMAEWRKLATTRMAWWLALAAVAIAGVTVMSISGQSAAEWAKPLREQQFFFLGTFTKVFLVILGIRAVTDEYRHGTILPTFLTSPDRSRVVLAKALAVTAVGFVVALVAQAALVGAGIAVASSSGFELAIGSEDVRAIVGSVLAGTLWSALGVGIGWIVRRQVAAIVGTLVWVMALEETLRPQLGSLADYLPVQGGFALSLVPDARAFALGAAVMTAWAVASMLVGVALTARRDVT